MVHVNQQVIVFAVIVAKRWLAVLLVLLNVQYCCNFMSTHTDFCKNNLLIVNLFDVRAGLQLQRTWHRRIIAAVK